MGGQGVRCLGKAPPPNAAAQRCSGDSQLGIAAIADKVPQNGLRECGAVRPSPKQWDESERPRVGQLEALRQLGPQPIRRAGGHRLAQRRRPYHKCGLRQLNDLRKRRWLPGANAAQVGQHARRMRRSECGGGARSGRVSAA